MEMNIMESAKDVIVDESSISIMEAKEDFASGSDQAADEIAFLSGELAAERERSERLAREKILRAHGVADDEDLEVYAIRLERAMAADPGSSFEEAAEKYFAAHPCAARAPAGITFGGTGKTDMIGSEAEQWSKSYVRAVKDRNYGEMSRLTRLKRFITGQ